MREEREMRVLKKKKNLCNLATVPSYIWDGTIAISQNKFGLLAFGLPIVEQFWGLNAKCS